MLKILQNIFKREKTNSHCGGASEGLGLTTDWHCHILPGVDDGVRTMDESLQILAEYERIGIVEVWFTPHIMEDIPNTTEGLRTRFAELKALYTGNVTLHLAAENMLDPLFDQRLAAGDVLPIGENGNHLLVETSYFNPPMDLHGMLERIKQKGYYPVLAHPERYVYMDEKDYRGLISQGIRLQLNLLSLVGMYGDEARKKSRWLLKNGYYTLAATDLHRIAMLGKLPPLPSSIPNVL